MKIKDLLKTEKQWTKFTRARDNQGNIIEFFNNSPDEVSWCLSGAVVKCYKSDKKRKQVISLIKEEIGNCFPFVSKWNDAPERTFQDVKNLVEKLNI